LAISVMGADQASSYISSRERSIVASLGTKGFVWLVRERWPLKSWLAVDTSSSPAMTRYSTSTASQGGNKKCLRRRKNVAGEYPQEGFCSARSGWPAADASPFLDPDKDSTSTAGQTRGRVGRRNIGHAFLWRGTDQ